MDFEIKRYEIIKVSYNILLLSNIGKERLGQVYLNINND